MLLSSINRFVRFKNIGLAIEALALARDSLPEYTFQKITLVLAGAYDVRLRESREVLSELQTAAQKFKLQSHVVFKPSCSETERMELLSQCFCLVYTPDQEHFGIGPLEAMGGWSAGYRGQERRPDGNYSRRRNRACSASRRRGRSRMRSCI